MKLLRKSIIFDICILMSVAVLWFVWIYQGIHFDKTESVPELTAPYHIEFDEDGCIRQTIKPETNYLEGVSLIFVGFSEDSDEIIRVCVEEKSGKELAFSERPVSSFTLGQWEYFELPCRTAVSSDYTLVITTSEAINASHLIGEGDGLATGYSFAKTASNLEKIIISLFVGLLLMGEYKILIGFNKAYVPEGIKGIFVIVMLLLQAILYIPNIAYKLGYINLDDSWRYFLNIAGHEGYKFGKDVFFTYGPLGYLCYMMNLPDNGYWFHAGVAIWTAIIVCYIYLLVRLFLLYKKGVVSVLSVAVSGICALGAYIVLERDNFLLYLLILCVSVLKLLDKETEKPRNIYIISNVLITLMFFAKFSTFTSGVAFLILFILYDTIICKQKNRYLLLAPGLVCMPILYMIYNPSITNLKDYVAGILKISSGWMETQQFDDGVYGHDLKALIVIMICYVVLLTIMLATQYQNASVVLALSASMFFVYKYATTRHGLPCGIWLFGMIYSVIPLTMDFEMFKGKGKVLSGLGVTLLLCITVTGALQANTVHNSFGNLKETLFAKAHNWTHLSETGFAETLQTDDSPWLSEEMLAVIGDSTVSVYPTKCALRAIYPDLNVVYYPSVQNVNEFIPWMDEKTAAWMDSDKASDFILLMDDTIDDHIKYLECPLTWQSLQRNYEVDSCDGKWCLLRKKYSGIDSKTKILLREEKVSTKDLVSVPSEAEYAEVYVDYSAWGKLKKFFYHVYCLNMSIEYEDGSGTFGKIMTPNLVSGFEVYEHPQSMDAFVSYMSEDSHKRIKEFDLCGRGVSDLEDEMIIRWYSYE